MKVKYKTAAKHLGISKGLLYRLVAEKKIPHIRVGPRAVLFDLEALDRWLAGRTIAPSADAPSAQVA